MNYYIIDKDILAYESEFDVTLYNYQKLNSEQSAFYELHKCSLNEVLNLQLNPIYEPTLTEIKANKIQHFSNKAFELRELIYPEYKLINASLGVYDATETLNIKRVVEEFREEFYRLKTLIESATTKEEVELITDNYGVIQ